MTTEAIEELAMKLFRTVQGKGDCGSTSAFWSQNPANIDGWKKLARHILKLTHSLTHPPTP